MLGQGEAGRLPTGRKDANWQGNHRDTGQRIIGEDDLPPRLCTHASEDRDRTPPNEVHRHPPLTA